MKNNFRVLSLIFLTIFLLFSCNEKKNENLAQQEFAINKPPKYIFLFIGDGMSFSQVSITKAIRRHDKFRLFKKPAYGDQPMAMEQFPVTGVATTFAEDRYITESSAAGTALATGKKTSCGTVSMNSAHTQDYKTIAEMARDKGMKVGIVSSVSIDHATPACFYAHEKDRGQYNHIASQMAMSRFDYFGGGFARGGLRDQLKKENAKNILQTMKSAGYKIATNKNSLMDVMPGDKCWTYNEEYDTDAALHYEIDKPAGHMGLADFTAEGIRILQNAKGFFMMVESGKIDWACHANDVVTVAHEMASFDESIAKAVEFYRQHPDETLIIITGDHECGGLSLGYSAAKYESAFDVLNHQKISYQNFAVKVNRWKKNQNISQAMVLDSVGHYFGLGNPDLNAKLDLSDYETKRLLEAYALSFDKTTKEDEEEYYVNYGSYDPLTVTVTHLLNQKAGINWSTYSHTPVPVPVYAMGVGDRYFNGQLDNTDIANNIIRISRLE